MQNNIAQQLVQSRILNSPSSPSDYADPENKAFPLVPAARLSVAHSYVHKYFNSSSKGGVTSTYSHQKFATVHENIVRAMLEHGFKHYMSDNLDDTLPQTLIDKSVTYGSEMIFAVESAVLTSEQINFSPTIDVAKLTEGDPNPFFVTVKALKTGVSGNKRRYSAEILQKVKSQLPVYGYLGHISEKELPYAYRDPVTIWFAGEIANDWLYCKGYVYSSEKKLRQDIELGNKINRPKPVSVLGIYNMKPVGEIMEVTDINPLLSIDWANYGQEGIKGAHVIDFGSEQKNNHKEVIMTREEILAALTMADLIKERPDLISTLKSEMVESDEAKKKQKESDEKIKTLEAENLRLNKLTVDTHRTKLLSEYKDEKFRTLASELLKGDTIADLDTNFPGVKAKVANLTEGMPIITGAGDTKPGSDFINKELL
jgi:hypothetical protein